MFDPIQLIDYEEGNLSEAEAIELFQDLIDSGYAWQLPGSYGRTADALIEAGLCTLGEQGHRNYWGNYVPSKHEVKPGSVGSEQYARENGEEI